MNIKNLINKMKRPISLILAVVILLGVFPHNVLAVEYVGPSDTTSEEPLPKEIKGDLPRLIFKPSDFTEDILNGNTLPFVIMFSKPSNIQYTGKEDYIIRIQIDERLAEHITYMESEVERPHNYKPGDPIIERQLLRMANGIGGWRNIWEINYSDEYGGLIVGKGHNTYILNGEITLNDTLKNILEGSENYPSEPITYGIYIADINLQVI